MRTLAVLSVFVAATFLAAGDGEYEIDRGLYVGLTLSNSAVEGDFDGDSVLVGNGQVMAIPSLDRSGGYGLSFGQRGERLAWELGYVRTGHTGSFLGATTDVTQQILSLDTRFFMRPHRRLQPLVTFGWIPWAPIEVKEGSASSGGVSDATFRSKIFGAWQAGAGVSLHATPALSFQAMLLYQYLTYGSVEGGGLPADIENSLDGSGIDVVAGLNYNF